MKIFAMLAFLAVTGCSMNVEVQNPHVAKDPAPSNDGGGGSADGGNTSDGGSADGSGGKVDAGTGGGGSAPVPTCDKITCNDALNNDTEGQTGIYCSGSEDKISSLEGCSAEFCSDTCGPDMFHTLWDSSTAGACLDCLEGFCRVPLTNCTEDK